MKHHHRVYLALGTNMGDRLGNIRTALSLIGDTMPLSAQSHIYESDPMYEMDQPEFLNMVCCVQTSLPPDQVLRILKSIEQRMGRTVTYRNGPRVIDIDLLFYGDSVVHLEEPDLIIPHARYAERGFVLQPMVDINPHYICPKMGKTMQYQLDSLKQTLKQQGQGLGLSVFQEGVF